MIPSEHYQLQGGRVNVGRVNVAELMLACTLILYFLDLNFPLGKVSATTGSS